MKKKTSIIVSVIIAIILLILLIIGITYKKPDDAILKSEKSYLAMLVRNENIQNSKKIDNVEELKDIINYLNLNKHFL